MAAEGSLRAPRYGTLFATHLLTKSAFGPPTCPGLDRRLEKSQNLVSTNDPEVIESLKASCRDIGIVMSKFTTPTILELFEMWGELKEDTRLDGNDATTYLRRLRDIFDSLR